MYAIVDIETTGSYASGNGITEIAIRVHDGNKIIQSYNQLTNPGIDIPDYITAFTGISNEMVRNAPRFDDIAEEIYSILADKIFIAHSVNFDYSYIYHQLKRSGYTLQVKKLCTVRLSRKIFPGLASYSLGKLCHALEIPLEDRHRAGGDVDATTILFEMLLENDKENLIEKSLNKISKEQVLPLHLSREQLDALPQNPGVYYFEDQKGKVIYVGKAKNLYKRVCSHFSGNNPGRQRQEFLTKIANIRFEVCATELMAFILEATEIKRLWPDNNRALKRFEQKFALYEFEDQNGYLRLSIDTYKKFSKPVYHFNTLTNGHNLLNRLIKEFNLCPKLCFIQRNTATCTGMADESCKGACEQKESPKKYNKRVSKAINHLRETLPSFILVDEGRTLSEQSYLLIEQGKFYGMGYLDNLSQEVSHTELKNLLTPYPSNEYIINLILSHAEQNPHKIISL